MIPALALVGYLMGNPEQVAAAKKIDLESVAKVMAIRGVDVEFTWQTCGEENAFYYPPWKAVVMCYELTKEPVGVIRFIAAHEMAHAIVMQLDLPVVGNDEEAADELAALFLVANGMGEDVLSGAIFLQENSREHRRFEAHPPGGWRAENLVCLADGAEVEPVIPKCRDKFRRSARSWERIVNAALDERLR